MTPFKKKIAAFVTAALCLTTAPSAHSAYDETAQCTYWITTTTGWVCLSDSELFVRVLPYCPEGHVWRVIQGDRQQLWECRS